MACVVGGSDDGLCALGVVALEIEVELFGVLGFEPADDGVIESRLAAEPFFDLGVADEGAIVVDGRILRDRRGGNETE